MLSKARGDWVCSLEAANRETPFMILAVCFTNFGPYHLSRLRALALRLRASGDCLIAYEVAGNERTYPWQRRCGEQPFDWITLFPDRILETLTPRECSQAMVAVLDRDQPDALGIVGYARPESMAAVRWARRRGEIAILMSESQAVDRPRVWWKELIKSRRVRLFDAALVGGLSHRIYLAELGMPEDCITLGYNVVDNLFYQSQAGLWRNHPDGRKGLPKAPFFLSVCRFVPEKNLLRLIEAFAGYRNQSREGQRWDLVVCGDGPHANLIHDAIARSGHAESIRLTGFLQADELARLYAQAAAFVLPSISEPWGLVVNEAAATGLPLLVSRRAGCAQALVPEPEGTTGARFDPFDIEEMTHKFIWLAELAEAERLAMGERAAAVVNQWGPDRFARGILEALEMARQPRTQFKKHLTLAKAR
jgi:glycosyltransferase involved in cell wall biosynthesis